MHGQTVKKQPLSPPSLGPRNEARVAMWPESHSFHGVLIQYTHDTFSSLPQIVWQLSWPMTMWILKLKFWLKKTRTHHAKSLGGQMSWVLSNFEGNLRRKLLQYYLENQYNKLLTGHILFHTHTPYPDLYMSVGYSYQTSEKLLWQMSKNRTPGEYKTLDWILDSIMDLIFCQGSGIMPNYSAAMFRHYLMSWAHHL